MFNILLVDDEPIVKIALRTMIDWDNLGFPICGTASDGLEALALVKELNPHIIITDLKMPNMNGIELIRALNEMGYNGKIIVASNFGEYELVREALLLGAVDYMLKISIKTEALIEQLQKTAKLIQDQQLTLQEEVTREQVLRSNLKSVKSTMLRDYFTKSYYDSEYLYQNKEIRLHLENKICYPFLIYVDASSSREGQKNNISMSFIENMILDLIESEQDVEVFQVEANAIIVLITKDRLLHCQFEPLSFVHKIQKLIQMYMSIEPIIVYSPEVCGYAEARDAYVACKDAIDINFYEMHPHAVIYTQDITLKQEIEFANYVDFSNSILSYIYKDNSSSIQAILTAFIAQSRQQHIHPVTLKIFMNKCLDYLPLSDQNLTLSNTEQYENNKNQVLDCKNSEVLLTVMMDAIDCLSVWGDMPNTLDTSVTRKEIVEVMSYVGLHYRDKITLEMIADHVNFSENYLCRVFREQTGMSLINYINNVRLNKAAELIMKGHTYIKEISNAVGISDQFYFSRMFKKHFGVSPTDYKSHVIQTSQQRKQKQSLLS